VEDRGTRKSEHQGVRLFKARGSWVPEGVVMVGLRNQPGGQGKELGYVVLAPFVEEGGRVLLANRGWVPASLHKACGGDRKNIADRVFCKVQDVEIEGVFQNAEKKVGCLFV
jgi:cytochrome oxidase assembly protein ShyY1